MKNLILAGGGDEKDSKPLDKLFISLIPKNKKILYLPIAWKTGDFESCKKWFTSTFSELGFTDIEMWTELSDKKYADLVDFGGIYIGGGNTFSLLNDLRTSGFDKSLKKFIQSGKPVYGGSAGAIIFGKDIRTAFFGTDPDENIVKLKDFSGFNLIQGYTIQCHYEPNQERELSKFSKENNLPVIALSERSGLHITNLEIKIIGFDPAYIFEKGSKKTLKPNSKLDLS